MSIDLHIHSTFSDGTYSPTELVEMAARKMLTAISITDHDTMDGVDEAVEAGKRCGVEVVPGIEISAQHDGEYLHILGYFMDIHNQVLLEKLKIVQEGRTGRNCKILEKLCEFDIHISEEELLEISGDGQTGRPHIAQLLVKKKAVKNLDEAFDKYLGKDGLAFVHRFIYPAEEAITHITDAGGIAVLAHPVLIDYSLNSLPEILDELTGYGLGGIETYYPTHSTKVKKKLRQFGEQYQLVLTGGSDYHGEIREGTSLATGKRLRVPAELLTKMKERLVRTC